MLEKFFAPESVAVVGASSKPGKVGFDVLKNLKQHDFPGPIYPVNPKADRILGLECAGSIREIAGPVDLAVVVVPRRLVLDVFDELAEKGVGAAIVISAGFKETDAEGRKLESELTDRARAAGIRVLGPNCLGMIDTYSSLNATFAAGMPVRGNIAFMSQSGALCTSILDWAIGKEIGFSKFVSLGNKADINESDILDVCAEDPHTNVILAYLEGVVQGERFMESAARAARKKPVVIIKSGTSDAGARAASSHTGALAGSDRAYDSAFRQAGVIRARTIQDLFDFAIAFSFMPLPASNRMALLTNAGGPGIMATDSCAAAGVEVAAFSIETIAELRDKLPSHAAIYNPVDVIGDALADRYRTAAEAVIRDPGVDGLLVLLTPQASTQIEETAKVVANLGLETHKPVFASFMGEEMVASGRSILVKNRIPNYDFPERAVRAFEAMDRYRRLRDRTPPPTRRFDADYDAVRRQVDEALARGRIEIGESEARDIIRAYGFRTPENRVAETSVEAGRIADEIGFPVALKIASPDILHKTDVGGVMLGLDSVEEVERGFRKIVNNARRYMPEAVIWGVAIQDMAPQGKEVIVGMSRDPVFGPMIMFGLGGVYVETLKDVSFRIAPINPDHAMEMIREIRSYMILKGVRGEASADIPALAEALERVSMLVTDFPEIVEMDINPLRAFAAGEGVMALDVRFTLKEGSE